MLVAPVIYVTGVRFRIALKVFVTRIVLARCIGIIGTIQVILFFFLSIHLLLLGLVLLGCNFPFRSSLLLRQELGFGFERKLSWCFAEDKESAEPELVVVTACISWIAATAIARVKDTVETATVTRTFSISYQGRT
jgi:hypothetical protein